MLIGKNKLKMLKKALVLFFAFLFSIESFAAVVSDNDGAAFVTKAEFEALKEDFDNQIENYNMSLDSKVDGAIASYLAGLNIQKIVEIENVYERVGGNKIRFGKPSIEKTADVPVAGYAIYVFNSYPEGFSKLLAGAHFSGINNPLASIWTAASGQAKLGVWGGGGTWACFYVYKSRDGAKYILERDKGMLQYCYEGGWYSNVNKRNMKHEYPFGTTGTKLGEFIQTGTMTSIDSFSSVARSTLTRNWKNASLYTSSWDVDDDSTNLHWIEEDNYKLPSEERDLGWDEEPADSDFHSDTLTRSNINIKLTNIKLFDWKYTTENYLDKSPGFLNGSGYKTKLYGGVPFFELEKAGEVIIDNLIFQNTSGCGTNDVYFAISDSEFANSETISSSIKFNTVTGATLHNATQNLYKTTSGTKNKITFDAKKGGTYYIKCQYKSTSTSNDNNYTTINNGATISWIAE